MKLEDLIEQRSAPEPWSQGDKIPWDEPGFSRRMLTEHLSQAHDRASRRNARIDAQIAWIHEHLLESSPARVLDLGCGPGLYLNRLTPLGHTGVGVDFSPASIHYARESACSTEGGDETEGRSEFLEADLRDFDPADLAGDHPFDLAMLLSGEANAFRPEELEALLARTATALAPGGRLLLEPHDRDAIAAIGTQAPSWYASSTGLFSDLPHLCLHESFWDEARGAATERWWIVDASSGEIARHAQSMQAYSDDEYRALVMRAGFEEPLRLRGLPPDSDSRNTGGEDGLCALVARTAGQTG